MTTLREAMRARLHRFTSGERSTTEDTLSLLRAKRPYGGNYPPWANNLVAPEALIPTIDVMASLFESQVGVWLDVVDEDLREEVLADPAFLAERWPVEASMSTALYGSGNDYFEDLGDPELSGVYLVEGLVPVGSWPLGAEIEPVLRWWSHRSESFDWTSFDDEWPRSDTPSGNLKFICRIAKDTLSRLNEFRRGNALRWRETPPTSEDDVWLEALNLFGFRIDLPWIQPSSAAVMYLAQLRARPKVHADDAARETWLSLSRLSERRNPLAKQQREAIALDALRASHDETDSDFSSDERNVEALADELRARLEAMRSAVGLDGPEPPNGTSEEDGMLAAEACFATFLAHLGAEGQRLADAVRESARERMLAFKAGRTKSGSLWTKWLDEGRLRMLTRVLWQDVVRPRIERAAKKPAAIVRAVTAATVDLLAYQAPRSKRNGQEAIDFPVVEGWSLAPSIAADLHAAVLKGVGALSSEVAIDFLEWSITTAHRQYLDGDGEHRRIAVEGGWAELGRQLGSSSKQVPDKVKSLVYAFAHMRYESRGWQGNLLSYAETKAAPGRKACVVLTLGDLLLPGHTFALKHTLGSVALQAREDQQLVPVLGRTAVVGSPATYGAQRRMPWVLATLLRSRAPELAREGSVLLTPNDRAELAVKAGAPQSSSLLGKVWTAWEEGDEKVSPLIVEAGGDRITLHESRKPALDFIKQAGEISIRQSHRGTKAAEARGHTRKPKKPA